MMTRLAPRLMRAALCLFVLAGAGLLGGAGLLRADQPVAPLRGDQDVAPLRGNQVVAPLRANQIVAPLRDVGFDQKLGEQVPLDLTLRDESGAAVRLGDLLGRGRPAILSLVYYDCPMICGMALQGIASALVPLRFTAGKEFEVITVSFDPRETPELARAKKANLMALYGRPEAAAGWHFLTGDAEAIGRLTRSVGFRYVWDAGQKQFAHPTGVVLLTPQGVIARYLFGIEYAPKDLRFGLMDASQGRIGTLADRLLLLCYNYDPATGRYGGLALNAVRAGGVLTVLLLGGFVVGMVRRERSGRARGAGGPARDGERR